MSEEEFWNSTLYKINKLYEFYKKEHGLIDNKNNSKKVINTEKAISKWGRPITYSNDF